MTQRLIPTHIITGFLGVGKTTAINHLIQQKPADEKWALVINEFGQVGIDQTQFETSDTLTVKEIPGGCVCCTMGPALTIQLAMMIRRVQPDRIIIEPTGLGHPAALIDLILSESFNASLSLQSVITLMDPRALNDERTRTFPTFIDQIQMADTIALNKTDLCDKKDLEQAHRYLDALYPAKTRILETVKAKLPIELLMQTHSDAFAANYPEFHNAPLAEQAITAAPRSPKSINSSLLKSAPAGNSLSLPSMLFQQKGQPNIEFYEGNGAFGVSAVYHPDDVINVKALEKLLGEFKASLRLKALIRDTEHSYFVNQVEGQRDRSHSAWRRDSRIEIIQLTPFNQEKVRLMLQSIISFDNAI